MFILDALFALMLAMNSAAPMQAAQFAAGYHPRQAATTAPSASLPLHGHPDEELVVLTSPGKGFCFSSGS